ncbi:hypothetical protein TWF102_002464 [Orbilia oligospora]|uniref:Uncharacterized protein n=1 Tax=Orbilia oligospora TaxID=2813651 RepID=A0A7C8N3J9_ORBOL|nr:hypothetical protein TWF102_002464 [Orbilia oligospora]KAF3098273.1 hypothetical protein TWF103_009094 [Orbilia oligospora]KAF3148279.1 hypothetical protein TWF594_001466 [Orbilia oligospora]
MKGTSRSSKLFLKSLQVQSKPLGPFAKLASVFNHPVLTDSESKVFLNEVNSSFRNALKESRHPDDIRPPPSIHNAYANKADNHIYQVLTDPRPTSPPHVGNLRNLLDSEALVDTRNRLEKHECSPITTFQNHLLQGTADLNLATECCKEYVLNQLKSKPDQVYGNEGFRMCNMIRGNSLFLDRFGIPHPPLRGWLIASLLISRRPLIPFQWLVASLEASHIRTFQSVLSEIMTSYGKLYNTPESPNEDVKFFVHMLRAKNKDYRMRVSEHPTTKTSVVLKVIPLLNIHVSMQNLNKSLPTSEPQLQLFEVMAEKLYRKKDDEGKRMLAESMGLWNTIQSPFGMEVLIESGDFAGAAEYLSNFPRSGPPIELWQLISVGLLLVRQLKHMHGESGLLDRVKGLLQLILGHVDDTTSVENDSESMDLSFPETIMLKWNQYKGNELRYDRHIRLELDYLNERIRNSLDIEDK